jgi:taurine dioxygenase
MAITIKPLAFGLGAEIRGLSLNDALSADALESVRAAWWKHQVLVFPQADISVDEHIAFSKRFGELELHPFSHGRSIEHPEVFEVTNRMIDGKRSDTADVGRKWHSDGAFTLRPPVGSLLHCRKIPSAGGTTWFTNMYMAYDTLSDAMKRMIDGLEVVNDISMVFRYAKRDPVTSAQHARDNPPVVQPMVRVHPETGRRALFLNETATRAIHGMTETESEGLLRFLFQHSVRPEFIYRHTWSVHDLVMWDNRCTMHLAPEDFAPTEIRQMYRTTLIGEPLGKPYPGD